MDLTTIQQCAARFFVKNTNMGSTVAAYKICGANANRVGLIIVDQTASILYGDSRVSYANGIGIIYQYASAPAPILLDFEHWGPLVQQEWWGSRLSGVGFTSCTEIIALS
jgi:hypothetical protein